MKPTCLILLTLISAISFSGVAALAQAKRDGVTAPAKAGTRSVATTVKECGNLGGRVVKDTKTILKHKCSLRGVCRTDTPTADGGVLIGHSCITKY